MKHFLVKLAAGTFLSTGFLLGISLALASSAQAGSTRSAPPPTVLSPDISDPWVLQLQNSPGSKRGYGARIAPAPAQQVRRAPQKKGLFQRRTTRRAATRQVVTRKPNGFFWSRKRQPVRGFANTSTRSGEASRRSGIRQDLSGPMTPDRVNRMIASQNRDAARQKPVDPQWLPQTVNYNTSQPKGTIIIDTESRHLYLVQGDGKARRYGVGVGKPGFEWAGTHKISRKAQWPDWRPPEEMIERERANGRELPAYMEGGLANPLGARAMYIGSTLYRIHGTNQPWTIGQNVSSGCIRMRNEDVIDLYERVGVGTKVIVS